MVHKECVQAVVCCFVVASVGPHLEMPHFRTSILSRVAQELWIAIIHVFVRMRDSCKESALKNMDLWKILVE